MGNILGIALMWTGVMWTLEVPRVVSYLCGIGGLSPALTLVLEILWWLVSSGMWRMGGCGLLRECMAQTETMIGSGCGRN
jgi:hypothetical protein